MIKANIIKDSVNSAGDRITTWILTYNRFFHSEIMTHRVFSRNAASSRAIPAAKLIAAVRDNPAMPEFWGENQKGMQAVAELDDITPKLEWLEMVDPLYGETKQSHITAKEYAKRIWIEARNTATEFAEDMMDKGVHKQIVNRIIEPWSHITILLTATEYHNFFELRAHKDAQPEFQVLAYMMLEEYLKSTPTLLMPNEWHIPFGDQMPDGLTIEQQLKIATARAARISYLTFEGAHDPQKDYDLHDRLLESGHLSPFEHCACAAPGFNAGNFDGWHQYRKQFKKEAGKGIVLTEILKAMPAWVRAAIERNRQGETYKI